MSFAEIAAFTLHDIKNSLTQLAGQAEARNDLGERDSILHVAHSLNRLLLYYRCEENNLHPQIQAYAPADLLQEVKTSAQATLAPHQELVINLDHAPILSFFDPHLLRMILHHAVQNAQRFANSKITLLCRKIDGWTEIEVRDDGPGFPEAWVSHQANEAGLTSDLQSGLGLLLAQRLIALHTFESRQGVLALSNDNGACLSIRIPD